MEVTCIISLGTSYGWVAHHHATAALPLGNNYNRRTEALTVIKVTTFSDISWLFPSRNNSHYPKFRKFTLLLLLSPPSLHEDWMTEDSHGTGSASHWDDHDSLESCILWTGGWVALRTCWEGEKNSAVSAGNQTPVIEACSRLFYWLIVLTNSRNKNDVNSFIINVFVGHRVHSYSSSKFRGHLISSIHYSGKGCHMWAPYDAKRTRQRRLGVLLCFSVTERFDTSCTRVQW